MRNDALQEVEGNIQIKVPNDKYQYNNLFTTFNSISDVDNFFNRYNHDNGYNGLALGQKIQINDGVYNRKWIIAGFDMEYNRTNGVTVNNGYGISLIPDEFYITKSVKWNNSDSATPYINSTIHTSTLTTVSNNLRNVLGDHLVNRNVMLGSNASDNGTTGYTWTTAYCTLPSLWQFTGTRYGYNSIYDDGEASYKLPVFDYIDFRPSGSNPFIWTRAYFGKDTFTYGEPYSAFVIQYGSIAYKGQHIRQLAVDYWNPRWSYCCPMIYIR